MSAGFLLYLSNLMKVGLIALTLLLHAVGGARPPLVATSGSITVALDPKTAAYTLRVGSETWLESAPTQLLLQSVGWLTFEVRNSSSATGFDALGSYTRLFAVLESRPGKLRLEVGFRVYTAAKGVLVAEQIFLDAVSLGGRPAGRDLAASTFPNWRVGGGMLGQSLHFLAGCDAQPRRGLFPQGFSTNFLGGGLPLSLVHVPTESVLVMSPVGSFVTSTIALTNLTSGGQGLAAGVVGSVERIPAGSRVQTLLTSGDGGYTEAMMHWGDALLVLGGSGKRRSQHNTAPMLSHLGYSTTAFYFYDPIGSNDGSLANMSYAATILAVDAYAAQEGIPVHHYLLDSWWYGEYTGSLVPGTTEPAYSPCTNFTSSSGTTVCYSGMHSWDENAARAPVRDSPTPAHARALHSLPPWPLAHTVLLQDRNALMGRFPEGLRAMTLKLGKRGVLSQHMGRWLPSTPYRLDPRFDWTTDNKSYAYSNDPMFWNWLVEGAVRWGMTTLKQDHSDSQLMQTPRCSSELGFADSALAAQLNALEAHNCTMMGGGYTAKGWLHGSRHKALTHARVAGDYFGWCEPHNRSLYPRQWHPHCGHGNYWSWKVAEPSLASWALGMAPYKDTWFSSSQESQERRNKDTGFWHWHEPYPRTHALVSALTGGPILFGDGVNGSNTSLILRTCRQDGLLLKPDRPATPTDERWMLTLTDPEIASCSGDFATTHSSLELSLAGSNRTLTYTWLYALGVQLCKPYELSLREWTNATAAFRAPGRTMQKQMTVALATPAAMLAYQPEDVSATLTEVPAGISNSSGASSSGGVWIAAGHDYGTADFWMAAPVFALPGGGYDVALLGELNKFIAVSRQRIESITYSPSSSKLQVALLGAPGEKVQLSIAMKQKQKMAQAVDDENQNGGAWVVCDVEVAIGANGRAKGTLPGPASCNAHQ